MPILDFILGRPLASDEDKDERVGPLAGISVFGLDALSSAAYGPEAALTVLIPLGVFGIGFSLPITIAVSAILTSSILAIARRSLGTRKVPVLMRWQRKTWVPTPGFSPPRR